MKLASLTRGGRRALLVCAAVSAIATPSALAARAWNPEEIVSPNAEPIAFDGALTSDDEVVTLWTQDVGSWPPSLRYAVKAPGGSVGPPHELGRAHSADVATDGAGNTIATWLDSGGNGVMTSTRPALGEFSPPVSLGTGGSELPFVVANPRGDVAVVWERSVSGGARVTVATRMAGAAWSAPQDLSETIPLEGSERVLPEAAITASGELLVVWADDGVKLASRSPDGAVGSPQTISTPSVTAAVPRVAADAHDRAIVVWEERASAADDWRVKATLRDPLGLLSPIRDMGGPASPYRAPQVNAGPNGVAIISWLFGHEGPEGGQEGGLVAQRGDLASGTFDALQFSETSSPDGYWSFAIDAAGNSLLAYNDWSSLELQTVRIPASASTGPVQTVRCPYRLGRSKSVGIDSTGVASVLWAPRDGAADDRALRLSQDRESKRAGRTDCKTEAPKYTVSPQYPESGKPLTVDGSGAVGPDGTTDRWAWDFDDDGTFEQDTGDQPFATHTYWSGGYKYGSMKVTSTDASGVVTVEIYRMLIYIYAGPGSPGYENLPPPPGPPQDAPPPPPPPPTGDDSDDPARVTLAPRRSESIPTVLRRGLLVRLRSASAQTVSLRLLRRGDGRVVGTRRVKLKAGRRATVRVKVRASARRDLRHAHKLRLRVQARVRGATAGAVAFTLADARRR